MAALPMDHVEVERAGESRERERGSGKEREKDTNHRSAIISKGMTTKTQPEWSVENHNSPDPSPLSTHLSPSSITMGNA